MSHGHGVGVNGEPDDFAARYDRFALGGGPAWVIKVLLALAVILAGSAMVWSLLPL